MARLHMELQTEVMPVFRKELDVETEGLINPNNAGSASNPLYLLDGEFVTFNGANQWNREGLGLPATGGGVALNPADEHAVAKVPCFPVWFQRGQTDVQAVRKIPVLMGGGPVIARFHSNVLSAVDTWGSADVGTRIYINWLANGADRSRRRGISKTLHTNDNAYGKAVVHGWVNRYLSSSTDGMVIEVLLTQLAT